MYLRRASTRASILRACFYANLTGLRYVEKGRSRETAEKRLVTAQVMYIRISYCAVSSLVALASRRKLHNKEAWLPAEIPRSAPSSSKSCLRH